MSLLKIHRKEKQEKKKERKRNNEGKSTKEKKRKEKKRKEKKRKKKEKKRKEKIEKLYHNVTLKIIRPSKHFSLHGHLFMLSCPQRRVIMKQKIIRKNK